MPSPDPMDTLERDIQKARFEESDTDKYLSRRAKQAMEKTLRGQKKDRDIRRAYVEGYQAGDGDAQKKYVVAFGAVLLLILLLQAMF